MAPSMQCWSPCQHKQSEFQCACCAPLLAQHDVSLSKNSIVKPGSRGFFFLVPWGSWTQHSRLAGLNFQSIWKRNIKLAEFGLLVVIFISEAQLISAVNTAISLSEKKCLTSILASPMVDKGSRELTLIEFLACCLLVLHICLIFFFWLCVLLPNVVLFKFPSCNYQLHVPLSLNVPLLLNNSHFLNPAIWTKYI